MIHDMLADEVDGNPVSNKSESEFRVRGWPQWTYLLSGPLGMITSANFFIKRVQNKILKEEISS